MPLKIAVTLLLLVLPFLCWAGNNNNFYISINQLDINGSQLNVRPGDTIFIEAGRRPYLYIRNIVGTSDKPVVLTNHKGGVVLGGPMVQDAIMFLNSSHFSLTGTGDSNLQYGFLIKETKKGGQGIALTRFSTNYEIDHIEIASAGYSGIMAKTDPLCDGSADRGNFTMYDIRIHDNLITNTGGEGIYLGNSFYTGTDRYCNALHYPHEVKGVRVYNNTFKNNGREAIQVGSATEDCEIYGNRIYNYGTSGLHSQNNGIQVGIGTTGKVYNNFIQEGKGAAIVIQGIGNNLIFNNIIVSPGEEAFNINTREPLEGKGVYIINNTIINARKAILLEYINKAKNNVFYNNLIINPPTEWNQLKPYTDWKLAHNFMAPADLISFLNEEYSQFSLKDSNFQIKDAGLDVSEYGIQKDYKNKPRPSGKAYDIGAIEIAE